MMQVLCLAHTILDLTLCGFDNPDVSRACGEASFMHGNDFHPLQD